MSSSVSGIVMSRLLSGPAERAGATVGLELLVERASIIVGHRSVRRGSIRAPPHRRRALPALAAQRAPVDLVRTTNGQASDPHVTGCPLRAEVGLVERVLGRFPAVS